MWKNLLKLAISIATIYIVFREINPHEFWLQVKQIKLPWYLLAIGLQLVSSLVAAIKWRQIMKKMGYTLPTSFYLQSYFIGTLFNQVLPTSVGGDAVRIADTHRTQSGLRNAFYGVMADRYFGTLGLVILNIIPLFWLAHSIPNKIFSLICLVLGAVSTALIAALLLCKLHLFNRIKFTQLFFQLSRHILDNAKSFKHLLILLLLAVIANFLTIMSFNAIAHGLNINVSLFKFMAILPAVTLITLLPVSFAGWGIREGAMVTLLLFLNIPKPAILSLSVLYGVMLILSSLPGLYFYSFKRNASRSSDES